VKIYIVAAAICLGVSTVQADDSATAPGENLHEENCLSCHKPELYTNPGRRVTSREALSNQVRLCEQQLQLQWFDEEVESVADYLNQEFYKFK
jgi:CxxC motif-containing protein (DUF1111 family)